MIPFFGRWENSVLCILIYLHDFVLVTFIDALEGRCKRLGNYHALLYYKVFFLKAELHRIMSWDTWKWPQKFFSKSERSISPTFTLRNNKPYLHWYLPREPWENGSGCSGCFISMKIYHSQKDRKYGLKEKSRLLLI